MRVFSKRVETIRMSGIRARMCLQISSKQARETLTTAIITIISIQGQ